ncbi:P2X purinoceptor 7-like [Saccostrea cucullata]|uniref:P2X purinoceptor 7-like n=1 Tax=Saccostrea cuccullata TaxID=36930 RepID=UPI002ED4111D
MRMYQRQPSFVLDIIDAHTTNDNSNRPGSSCVNVPVWCPCTFCREMPVDTEKVRCNKTPSNYHFRLRDFDIIVLDELVLEVARRMREDMLVEARDQNLNRANRYAAYRQYILWIHGHLGAGNRRVIPSCVIWRIRDKYPDPFGHYVGFIDGRLG